MDLHNPGNPAGTELVIDTSQITTVYDLLNRLRAEAQQQQQNPQVIPQAPAGRDTGAIPPPEGLPPLPGI